MNIADEQIESIEKEWSKDLRRLRDFPQGTIGIDDPIVSISVLLQSLTQRDATIADRDAMIAGWETQLCVDGHRNGKYISDCIDGLQGQVAQLESRASAWHSALRAAAVSIEVPSLDDPKTIAAAIRDRVVAAESRSRQLHAVLSECSFLVEKLIRHVPVSDVMGELNQRFADAQAVLFPASPGPVEPEGNPLPGCNHEIGRWVNADGICENCRRKVDEQIQACRDNTRNPSPAPLDKFGVSESDEAAIDDLLRRRVGKLERHPIAPVESERERELHSALSCLYALVKGECPSILEDDHHDEMVTAALALPQQKQQERTPEQYAIEHGRYLATGARGFMDAVNKVESLIIACQEDETDKIYDDDIYQAQQDRSESFRNLERCIYEFTKRADRAYPLNQEPGNG